MLNAMRVVAGDLKKLYNVTLWNVVHVILTGAPAGVLFLVILELLKPADQLSVSYVVLLFAGMALLMVVNVFLGIRVLVQSYTCAYTLSTDARLRLGDHLRLLSLGFFKKRDPGDISALMLQDMAKVEMLFSHLFMDAIAFLVLPGMMCLFFLTQDVRMTGLMLASVMLAVPALLLAQRVVGYFGRRQITSRNQAASRLLEYLQGISVLKAFSMTGKGFVRLDRTLLRLRDDSIRLEAAGGAPIMLYALILDCGYAALLVYGAWLLSQGALALAAFVLFLVIGCKFFEPLLKFGMFFSEMRYMSLAAGRISEVMRTAPLKENARPRIPDRHDIAFEEVSFGYAPERKILDKVSFHIPERGMTALVGPSGSGKTTVTSLAARFWDVDAGSIRVGGVDVRDILNEKLNEMFSVVFQDVYLFQDSIFNNIRVGKKDATRGEVVAAAQTAQCHEFIEQMEQGYETQAGEGGVRLSGGERQRISIARALLKNAPIVILDEATASLDPENELSVQRAISALIRSKTVLVIAHRLKTVAGADQILVLDKGRVCEQGKHAELLRLNGLYARLWNEQQRAGGWKFRRGPAENQQYREGT
ncbi:MAG: ABC transporter ATP-binding protein/permease [Desulfovibrio sp.]|jgi:ATP-binding cassette subfamily B protein|nr:ABC transporter ATP-binding protein/permease [Desulfovibrio sp.]